MKYRINQELYSFPEGVLVEQLALMTLWPKYIMIILYYRSLFGVLQVPGKDPSLRKNLAARQSSVYHLCTFYALNESKAIVRLNLSIWSAPIHFQILNFQLSPSMSPM